MYNKKSKVELEKSLEREQFERITCSFYKYTSIDKPEYLRDKLYSDLNSDFNYAIHVRKQESQGF